MILVTGATGLVGGHVLTALCGEGRPVRALVRSPERGDALRGYDCETVVGTYEDRASLDEALRGVERVFLVAPPSERLAEQEAAVVDAVAAAGRPVHVVLLASAGVDSGATGLRLLDQHQRAVDHLRASGLPHTVLAPTSFAQNLLRVAARVQEQGALPVPVPGDAAVAHVDARDVAAVAAHVLTSDGHEGATYVVTGPEPVTYPQVAQRLAAVAGREVQHVDVPAEEWRSSVVASGVSEWVADGLLELYASHAAGGAAPTTDEVQKATGRPARSLDDFLADHRGAFAAAG